MEPGQSVNKESCLIFMLIVFEIGRSEIELFVTLSLSLTDRSLCVISFSGHRVCVVLPHPWPVRPLTAL